MTDRFKCGNVFAAVAPPDIGDEYWLQFRISADQSCSIERENAFIMALSRTLKIHPEHIRARLDYEREEERLAELQAWTLPMPEMVQ
jgi:hypothetical protein